MAVKNEKMKMLEKNDSPRSSDALIVVDVVEGGRRVCDERDTGGWCTRRDIGGFRVGDSPPASDLSGLEALETWADDILRQDLSLCIKQREGVVCNNSFALLFASAQA